MLLEKFIHYIQYERRYSEYTVNAYRTDLNQFFSFLEVKGSITSIHQVHYQFIRDWVIQLINNQISTRTVNRKITTLKTYFRFLIKSDLIKENPMNKIIPPKTSKRLPVFVDEIKMEQLFENIDFGEGYVAKRDKLILELFYLTGIRLSELINLKVTDINFSNHTIKVLGKRNKERIIPITSDVILQIKDLLSERESDYLFVSDNGKQLYDKQVYRLVNKYLSMVTSLDKTSPHVLRHTFATHMLNNGADINVIKELLGHTSLNATQVYTHNTIEKLKTAYKQAHPRA